MPTPRFTELQPPLEARLTESFLTQLNTVVGLGISATNRFNSTIHNAELTNRTANAILDALRPGSTTFALLVLLAVATCFHIAVIKRNTNRILRAHGHFLCDEGEHNGRIHRD